MGIKMATKFATVTVLALAMAAGVFGLQSNKAFAAPAQVSPIDPALPTAVPNVNVATSAATGFPLWYRDVAGPGGNRLAPCLGVNADGTGAADPRCIVLNAAGAQLPTVGAVGPLTFPPEVFYWVADAKFNIGLSPAVFRMALEGAFTNLASTPTPGQQTVFARINLRVNQAGAFAPNDTVTVKYPYGQFSFTTDALGAISTVTAPFAPQGGGGGGAKQIRAQDGSGALNLDFATVLATPDNTGITNFLKSVNVIPGYFGDGITPTAVTGSPIGRNFVEISGIKTPAVKATNFIIAGKLFAPTLLEKTPVKPVVPTDANTYTFNSNDNGTITVGGAGCSSPATAAVAGDNTIAINTNLTPANGTQLYNCTVTVTNAIGNASDVLAVKQFTVDLRPPFLSSIGITPLPDVVKVGATVQMSGTGLDQFGNPFATALTWSSSNTAVGTITSSGAFTALKTGTTTISAANSTGAIVGTTVVKTNTLVISNLRVVSKTGTSVTFAWDSSVPSNDVIRVGKTKAKNNVKGKAVSDAPGNISHTVTVSGLRKNTRYFFQVTSNDGTKTVKSAIKTVRTAKK